MSAASGSARASFPATMRTAVRQARTPRKMPRGAGRKRGRWWSSVSDTRLVRGLQLEAASASAAASASLLASTTGSSTPPHRSNGASIPASSSASAASSLSKTSSSEATEPSGACASSGGGRGDCGCGRGGVSSASCCSRWCSSGSAATSARRFCLQSEARTGGGRSPRSITQMMRSPDVPANSAVRTASACHAALHMWLSSSSVTLLCRSAASTRIVSVERSAPHVFLQNLQAPKAEYMPLALPYTERCA
mmetsp:Transcript_12857/g.37008  ORF Transcript_12857/g.37008 Transcript_12857/m.37008 type:complete len:251 (-) Transcript_12857:27-779(-)